MLLAYGADLADVVEKADVSFCRAVAFTDPDVSEPLQEVSPGVGAYPVAQGQSHFMVSVPVVLQRGGRRRDGTNASMEFTTEKRSSQNLKFTLGVLQR